MIRFFNLYIPSRTLILVGGEIAAICASFGLAIFILYGRNGTTYFNDGHVLFKIFGLTALTLYFSHYMEMYELGFRPSHREVYPRVFMIVGILCLVVALLTAVFPGFIIGHRVLVLGLCILSFSWLLWRWTYGRLIFLPALRERVFLIGDGERARRILSAVQSRAELGMDVVGWAGELENGLTCESMGQTLRELAAQRAIDRVIVALIDRRAKMPVNELLELRLSGVRIEDGTSLLEKVSGQIEVDELHPSWLIFGEGFRLTPRHRLLRRTLSTLLAVVLCILTLPILPLIALLIKLDSPGPILYRQKRVGLRNTVFNCYKFRTMRPDAEADSGPTWASDEDPRITSIGKFLRRTRLDEIPQLWNVLRGDMAFVGPRPERPEFVEKLSREIPYYHLRHTTRPGITGWAQINYGYGSSVEESKEKLRYDLYYVRNVSVMLDLAIVFGTLRAVVLGRGVR